MTDGFGTPQKFLGGAAVPCRKSSSPAALRVTIKTWRPQRVHISYAAINGEANSRKEREIMRVLTILS